MSAYLISGLKCLIADEICKAIKSCKDMQALCLEGNTVGVDAAKAIAEALSQRPEFEVWFCAFGWFYVVIKWNR